nr:xylulose kinase-1 [Tanacetum cinerariifolium]
VEVDCFPKVLKFKKSIHPSSGSTTPISDSSPSLIPFETSDSLLEEFTDELSLLDAIPPGKEDNNFDFEADLREIKYLLNQDPSTESNIETINPILEKFTNEAALDCLPPPGDDDDDDDLFDLKSNNDEWKKLLNDYPIWQVIENGNGLVSVKTDTNRIIKVLPPKTPKEVVAREKDRKARTTLLMALPEDHLAKSHKIANAKEM